MQLHFNRNRILLFSFVLFIVSGTTASLNAQTISLKNDLELIQKTKLKPQSEKKVRPYIFKNAPKTFKTRNPASLLYGGLLYVYQNTISQHFSSDCLYHPSCSDFSKQAVNQFGLLKGGLLTVDRLTRCTRISATDIAPSAYDPKSHRANDPISKYK